MAYETRVGFGDEVGFVDGIKFRFELGLEVHVWISFAVTFEYRYLALRIKFGFVFGSVCKFS